MRSTKRIKAILLAAAVLFASCGARCGGTEPGESAATVARAGGSADGSMRLEAARCVDGARAIEHIERLVALGPRHAGTEGAKAARRFIMKTLAGMGLSPERHDFTALTPHPELAEVEMANITVDLPGAGDKLIIIGGHFDGKIIDEGVFTGANDGGSSTGLLLELARCLAAHPAGPAVRVAFFDGEEALVDWNDHDSLYGSKRMVADLLEANEHKRVEAMVNIDMIGDARLRIFRESLSTPWVFAALERSAARLGHSRLMTGPRAAVEDDHVPFLRAGIPAANLIDLQFGPGYDSNAYWHTPQDSLDKLSADSLTAVGRIVIEALPDLAAGPPP